jgi:hypothetical protein
MPFINLNTEATLFLDKQFDATIIGAGAAGILLAVQLTKAGKKVLLIESGHFSIDEEKQKQNEVEMAAKNLANAVWGRKRAIGGTTLAWGGQCLPFTSIDFLKRPWVENSGWPIAFDIMEAYYKEATAFMGVDTLDYHSDIFSKAKIDDPGIDASLLDFHVSKWAREPNFQVLYKDFLQANVMVVYNAQLQRIFRLEDGSVDKIEIQNFNKDVFYTKIKILIIAAGGIETNRILLNNNAGNHSGWLGKCFMDHPCIEIGDVVTNDQYRLQKHFNTHLWDKRKYSVRLSLSKKIQEEKKILNCSAGIMFKPSADKFDPYAELVSFKKDFKLKRLLKVSGSSVNLIKSIWAYIKHGFYYKVNADNKLVLMIEQEPITSSQIGLSIMNDAFGIPKAKISWNISYKTWETVLGVSGILKTEIERLGLGEVKLYEHIKPHNENWADTLSDVNHHMGGCRMSAAPEGGVVNENLQVWGIPNLFVCSCAVFPTASHSNPTLTMLALGMRLSEYLLNENLC